MRIQQAAAARPEAPDDEDEATPAPGTAVADKDAARGPVTGGQAAQVPGHGAARPSWVEWLTTTDHKKIGTLYLVTAFAFFVLGGVMALAMRLVRYEGPCTEGGPWALHRTCSRCSGSPSRGGTGCPAAEEVPTDGRTG
ncbi:hypothetical protein [Streptomyces sp. NPDC001312]|uniref:hypothetical protein n=1 Tax=Streptomyces sp. NPDC001312 TaxID=3364561 RepID=UPI003678E60E